MWFLPSSRVYMDSALADGVITSSMEEDFKAAMTEYQKFSKMQDIHTLTKEDRPIRHIHSKKKKENHMVQPPFNKAVKMKIGSKFLDLVRKHFATGYKLYIILIKKKKRSLKNII